MLFLKHFWILGIVVPCINAAIYARRARRVVREAPESEEVLSRLILITAVWCGLPFVVAGAGNLTGGTTSMLDYAYPDADNHYVVAFHAVVVVLSLAALYWLLARGGFDVLTKYSYVFFAREHVGAYKRIQLLWAIGGALVAVAIMWSGVFPDVRPELGELPS